MAGSFLSHLHFGGANISYRKRLRLFFVVVAVVIVLSAVKSAVHYLGFELLELNTLFTSGIAGAIFIVGFLLSSILTDYKEAERIPADIRMAMEAIDGDLETFADADATFDLGGPRRILVGVIEKLREGLSHERHHEDIGPALQELSKLTPILGRLEDAGMPANFIVRLRGSQDLIRRSLLRIYQIQKVEFVPSVHVLVQTLVLSIVTLMVLLKTEGDPASAILFGFISYMFVYVLYLIRLLEQPFAKGHGSADDVSLFLLDELRDRLRLAQARKDN